MKGLQKFLFALTTATILSLGVSLTASAAEVEGLTVNGTGVVSIQPDTATISLTAESLDKTAEAAQAANNKILESVTKAMTDLGIKKDELLTAYTSVYPNYVYNDETGDRTVTGYRAYTNLEVMTKDVDHTGKFIDAALKAGATGSNGVTFSLSDPERYYNQALTLAVKNATDSAKAIAAAYNKPLGEILSVTENTSIAKYAEESGMAKEMAVADSAGGARSANTVITYDKIDVTARISATYGF